MASGSVILPVLLVSLFCSAFAQIRNGNLKVRVTFDDGRPCTLRVRVQLMLSAGSTGIAENYTNDQGLTEFDDVEVGNYHVVVSGDGIQTADSGLFEVDNRHGTQFQTITVRRTDEGSPKNLGGATVAVQDINIPRGAKKQFNKASDLIAREEWKKAIEHLKEALAIYPQYVEAYNNLGVVYARVGDHLNERAALQRAVTINDHFAPAWLNLGRMEIRERAFPAAENFLIKANAIAPTDPETLTILANVELVNLHYEQAIVHCQKAHSLGVGSHTLVHFIAARAYEHESQLPEAVGELEIFLKEEPSGVRADAARRELTRLQRH